MHRVLRPLSMALAAGALVLGVAALPPHRESRAAAPLTEFVRPAAVPFPADNPYSAAKAALGEKLFFDTALSGDGSRSCASCHQPALDFQDGMPRHDGLDGKPLPRRTPGLLDGAFGERFFWDGRADSLEAQALGPIQAPAEMNRTLDALVEVLRKAPDYPGLFAAAFPGSPEITPATIGKAIATYERTLVSGETPFDRWMAGDAEAIPDAARRGFALFVGKANCAACHSGWTFTDHAFHDIGLASDDRGRGGVLGLDRLNHAFKTPSLRGVARRAPYAHDGSVPTLEAAVDHYRTGIVQRPTLSDDIKRIDLDDAEAADLVAFLRTLDPDRAPAAVAAASPEPAPAAAPSVPVATVVQKNKRFSQPLVHLARGGVLTIDNRDTRDHNIRIHDGDMDFNSGIQAPGQSVNLPFATAGDYLVFCGIHPHMKLEVQVGN